MWDLGVVPHLCCHMTNAYLIPQLSMVDVMLDGEDKYCSPPSQEDFLDHWAPDRLRVTHSATWGPLAKWLGWHGGKGWNLPAWMYRQDRAWIANLTLHDIQWPVGGPYDDAAPRALGMTEPDAVAVPYWDPQGLFRTDQPDVYVTAWKRPDQCAMIVVNRGTNRVNAVVNVDAKLLGLGAASAAEIVCRDADGLLLKPEQYLDDPTTVSSNAVALPDDMKGVGNEPDLFLDEKPALDKLPRDQHPDAVFTWQGGVLRCAVRRHDYRLFEFRKR